MDIRKYMFREKNALSDFRPAFTGDYTSRDQAEKDLQSNVLLLAELQEKLYAADQHGMLIILQAMDAAGKDGIIKHVMSAVNPQGCQVRSFKTPSGEELDHDYMWRCMKHLPERGNIAIFNRSYYEEVLVVRVHPEYLSNQKLPLSHTNTDAFWKERYRQFVNFEQYMAENGFVVVKLFLNISEKEQKKRFLKRIDEEEKNWKFSINDIEERQHWKKYMFAYEQMLIHTSTEFAPWYVVPSDNKWFSRLLVSNILVETLEKLNLSYPVVSEQMKLMLNEAKKRLENE
jgi:PPK2 family polyphosphate:nucleotide phosphotransferase